MELQKYSGARLLELLACWVFSSGLIGLALGLSGYFDAWFVLLLGLLTTVIYASKFRPLDLPEAFRPDVRHLLIVVAVAALFRIAPYHYVLGDQDQGVYVNMAAELVHTRDIVTSDPMLGLLQDPGLIEEYKKSNYNQPYYVPGVYRVGREESLQFQFYHLFPVYMAIAGGIAGLSCSAWALTFLSLLGVAFFYWLALAVTLNRRAALWAGLLLAVNPLHVFFTKFPVTEVPTLLFSTVSFTFLALYWRSPAELRNPRLLMLSAVSMACLFFTRISGFEYLPFLMAVAFASLIMDRDVARRRGVMLWAVGVLIAYVASVLYGLHWSTEYTHAIYTIAFGTKWRLLLALLIVSLPLAWLVGLGLRRFPIANASMIGILIAGRRWLGLLMWLILAYALYRGYVLGFTQRYVDDPTLGQYWRLAGNGWPSLKSISMAVSVIYLSPFLLLSAYVCVWRRSEDPLWYVLLIFIAPFAAHIAFLQWAIPYQPYYARYLLSEFVPYVLLLCVVAWADLNQGAGKKLLTLCLWGGGAWMLALSLAQVGKRELRGAAEALDRATAEIDRGDLLLFDRRISVAVKTPLVYIHGLNVMSVVPEQTANAALMDNLQEKFDDIYLLSESPAVPDPSFELIRAVQYRVNRFARRSIGPVSEVVDTDGKFFLYKRALRLPGVSAGRVLGFGSSGDAQWHLRGGWSSVEPWGVWSDQANAEVVLPVAHGRGCDSAELVFSARAFVVAGHERQRVIVSVDGAEPQQVIFQRGQSERQRFSIPLSAALLKDAEAGNGLRVRFDMPDAISPLEAGVNGDGRKLGIGLETVSLAEPSSAACTAGSSHKL